MSQPQGFLLQQKSFLSAFQIQFWFFRMALISFLSVVIDLSESCSMGLVVDRNLLHYPGGRFTLFQEVGNIVEIACPRSVFTMPTNLFNKSESRQIFDSRINRFLIYTAFFCNQSSWRKALHFFVAVIKQTTVNGKISRLQSQLKYFICDHKEIFVLHSILLSQFQFQFQYRHNHIRTNSFPSLSNNCVSACIGMKISFC